MRDATPRKGEAILPCRSAWKVTGRNRGRREQQQSRARIGGPAWQRSSKPTSCLHKITKGFLSVGPALPVGYVCLGGPFLPRDLPNCPITRPLQEAVISSCNPAVFCSKRPRVVWRGEDLAGAGCRRPSPSPRTHILYDPQPPGSRCCLRSNLGHGLGWAVPPQTEQI